MKVKLYRRLVKMVCKQFNIPRKRLFARQFSDLLIKCYNYNIVARRFERDYDHLSIISQRHPLSDVWIACDLRAAFLLKHWKHSHWKVYIQMRIDLGEDEKDVVASLCGREKKCLIEAYQFKF